MTEKAYTNVGHRMTTPTARDLLEQMNGEQWAEYDETGVVLNMWDTLSGAALIARADAADAAQQEVARLRAALEFVVKEKFEHADGSSPTGHRTPVAALQDDPDIVIAINKAYWAGFDAARAGTAPDRNPPWCPAHGYLCNNDHTVDPWVESTASPVAETVERCCDEPRNGRPDRGADALHGRRLPGRAHRMSSLVCPDCDRDICGCPHG